MLGRQAGKLVKSVTRDQIPSAAPKKKKKAKTIYQARFNRQLPHPLKRRKELRIGRLIPLKAAKSMVSPFPGKSSPFSSCRQATRAGAGHNSSIQYLNMVHRPTTEQEGEDGEQEEEEEKKKEALSLA